MLSYHSLTWSIRVCPEKLFWKKSGKDWKYDFHTLNLPKSWIFHSAAVSPPEVRFHFLTPVLESAKEAWAIWHLKTTSLRILKLSKMSQPGHSTGRMTDVPFRFPANIVREGVSADKVTRPFFNFETWKLAKIPSIHQLSGRIFLWSLADTCLLCLGQVEVGWSGGPDLSSSLGSNSANRGRIYVSSTIFGIFGASWFILGYFLAMFKNHGGLKIAFKGKIRPYI